MTCPQTNYPSEAVYKKLTYDMVAALEEINSETSTEKSSKSFFYLLNFVGVFYLNDFPSFSSKFFPTFSFFFFFKFFNFNSKINHF